MRICPTCSTAYPAQGRSRCTKDGTALVDAEQYAAARVDPLIGKVVAGRYEVHERVGVGGMGTVYRATQHGLDRAVALKVLKKDVSEDAETVTRFHREAKAMSMLMHSNTVRVFDFGQDDGHLFLAMEMLEGELLTEWAEREVTPPIIDAIEVVQEILRSLNEAHSKGFIHRDLKPDNIYLARVEGHARPVVKVLDFGIAKAFRGDRKIDQLETQAGTVFGTPRYMSPEQAQGRSLDHRSDLYSVGVLLYQLLAGRAPFIDDDAVVVMAKHIRDTPTPPRKLAPDHPIPRSLEKVAMRALAKEPDDRFDNADAFEEALVACVPDIYAAAERTGASATVGGALGSLPRVPLAIAGLVIMLGIGGALAIVLTASPVEETAAAEVAPDPPLAAASPPTAEAAEVSVRLESEPPGAMLLEGDREIGPTPQSVAIEGDEARHLTLRLEGYLSQEVDLSSDSAPMRRVSLSPLPVAEDPPEEPVVRRRGRRRSQTTRGSTPPAGGVGPYQRFD